jgi:hypothetical protein
MEHFATLVVVLIVAAALVAAITAMIRRKKSGKHTCSGNCDSCRGCQ